VYDTRDHDKHHSHVSCNYSFPFPFLDMLHGTYTGECWGCRYVAGKGIVGLCAGRKENGGGGGDGGIFGVTKEEGQRRQRQ
jgi:hypothetical protein